MIPLKALIVISHGTGPCSTVLQLLGGVGMRVRVEWGGGRGDLVGVRGRTVSLSRLIPLGTARFYLTDEPDTAR